MSDKPVAAGKSSFDLIDPREFFARIDFRPGSRVADLACGVGRYSVEIAGAVGAGGVVYAIDSWEEGIESLRKTIRDAGIANIRPILADITRPLPLADGSVDVCLLATILHDLPPAGRALALAQASRVLKPGGVLAVVEFRKVDRGPGPPARVRIAEQEAEALLAEHGFATASLGALGEFTYLLTARKSGGPLRSPHLDAGGTMLDVIRKRRSIRSYESREIPADLIVQLEEAALRAPTSRNRRPWRFVFVTGRERLAALAQVRGGSSRQLAGAALGVAVCADDAVSDCWVEDCSIAAIILQLAATSLGLGSCWIQVRGREHADGRPVEEHVRELLCLPGNLRVLCVISVGYPAEEKAPVPAADLPWDKVTHGD